MGKGRLNKISYKTSSSDVCFTGEMIGINAGDLFWLEVIEKLAKHYEKENQ
jgi:hypothetical protein